MAKSGRYIPLGVLALVFLALFLPPLLNVNRYRATITNSISQALGRPVKVDTIALRLVPQPGFDLENISIGDDPAISAEPILRAEEVTAYLRLSSLWRGQLEIAKLSLRYPSLNIVRAADGSVNLESLLWHASRTPVAPTSQRRPEARVRFPYIEAEDGRVNFRNGLDKSVFSFTEADFALWSPAENEWRMRLEAKPVRTDTGISDTGIIKAEATFHRAEQLRDIPVEGRVQWRYGQLGQLTKLAYGRDRSWRGALDFDAQFSGTPAELHVVSDVSVHDFRRFDITNIDTLRLQAHCKGVVSVPTNTVPGFDCRLPLGKGAVVVAGSLGRLAEAYELSVAAEDIPVNDLLVVARHTKKGLPSDLVGQGSVMASLVLRRSGPSAEEQSWVGSGTADGVTLRTSVLGEPLNLGRLQFVLTNPGEAVPETSASVPKNNPKNKKHPNAKSAPTGEVAGAFLHVLPMEIGEAPHKTRLSGSVSNSGYSLKLAGNSTLERFAQVARGLGVAVPTVNLLGKADFDLDVHGVWLGLPDASIHGTAKVSAAKAEIPGINSPVEITSANVEFRDGRFALSQLNATAGKLPFSGSAEFARSCESDAVCPARLDLKFADLDVEKLDALLNPRRKGRPWYRFFGSGSEESALPGLNADGQIVADKLSLGTFAATHFSSGFNLKQGELKLQNVKAELLGGSHDGEWQVDFRGKAPRYAGKGNLRKVNLSQAAALAKQPLGPGTLDAALEMKFEGWKGSEIADSMVASADFTWTNGVLRTITAPGHSPWTMSRFWGKAVFEKGSLRFEDCRMTTPGGSYSVSGTSTSDYQLALQLSPEKGSSLRISGTLNKPELTVVPLASTTPEAKSPNTPATSARK
jgi:hypothetical protein